MIIDKNTKGYQTRSDMPNENWTNNINVYVIEDGTELANKVRLAYPYYDFITDENDNLIDIEILEKPEQPEPICVPTIEDRLTVAEDTINFLLGL